MKCALILPAAIATAVPFVPKTSYAHRYFDTWAVEDPALTRTRWTTPDPMLDLYPGWSPYSYGLDNPLRNIDPSGDTAYAYNQNHDLVPIDNSPDIISWGRQDPNYVSGNFTWFTDFNWVMVDPIYGRFHNMRTQIIPTANGARWYEPKPTVNMGVFDLPIGPEELPGLQLGTEAEMGENLLPTARESLLNSVENARLRNAIDQLYRPGAKLGSGSSMDAFRLEGTHIQKLFDYRTNLIDILHDGVLNQNDRQIAIELLNDIQNALHEGMGGK